MNWMIANRFVLASALLASASAVAMEPDYAAILKRITQDIEALKPDHAQLETFSAQENLDVDTLTVSYAYHTHRSARRGGWTAGVPNPNDDGIWFRVDFHDADSIAQIHSQPASIPRCIGHKRVTFLILEGADTKPVGGAIAKILEKHGVADCRSRN